MLCARFWTGSLRVFFWQIFHTTPRPFLCCHVQRFQTPLHSTDRFAFCFKSEQEIPQNIHIFFLRHPPVNNRRGDLSSFFETTFTLNSDFSFTSSFVCLLLLLSITSFTGSLPSPPASIDTTFRHDTDTLLSPHQLKTLPTEPLRRKFLTDRWWWAVWRAKFESKTRTEADACARSHLGGLTTGSEQNTIRSSERFTPVCGHTANRRLVRGALLPRKPSWMADSEPSCWALRARRVMIQVRSSDEQRLEHGRKVRVVCGWI